MVRQTEIVEFTTRDQHPCWAITGGEQRIIVLTDQALYTATYRTKTNFEEACKRLADSSDILNDLGSQQLGKRRHEVPLDAIDRLEMFAFAHELRIRYTVENVTHFLTLRTPQADLYQQLFDSLRQRVAKKQDVYDEPAGALRVSIGPIVGMLATVVVGWFVHAAAEDLAAGKEIKGRGNPKAQLVILLVTVLGRILGPEGVIGMTTLIFAGFLAWWIKRLNHRPQRTVVDVRPY